MEKVMDLKFLMFENEQNNCWLDASVALIAHNKTFKKIVSCARHSQIKKIITIHDELVSILNDSEDSIDQRIKKTREMLLEIQTSTLQQLKQLKFKTGEPDSAFCALLNLIYRDKSNIKQHLSVSWIWRKMCTNCGSSSKSGTCIKPIITLTKVNKFQPECPASIYMCPCKTEQEMKLVYKELPPCLIFHFENGAGDGKKPPLSFTVKDREYELTGIILLEKSSDPNLNHFVTWIRNPTYDLWLDCNDLNTSIISFSPIPPDMNLQDVYICVFESFDNLDKLKCEMTSDQEQDIENFNIEVIDLSDEAEDFKSASENTSCKSTAKFFKNKKSEEISSSILIQNPKKQSKIDVPEASVFTDKESKTDSLSVQDVEKSDEKSFASTSSPFPATSEKNADFKNSSNGISGVLDGNKNENSVFENLSHNQEDISGPVKSDNNNAEIVSNSFVQPLQYSHTELSEISDKSSAISELSDFKYKLNVEDFPLTEKKDLNACLEGSTNVKKSESSAVIKSEKEKESSKSECFVTPYTLTKRTIKAPPKYKCFVATGKNPKKEKNNDFSLKEQLENDDTFLPVSVALSTKGKPVAASVAKSSLKKSTSREAASPQSAKPSVGEAAEGKESEENKLVPKVQNASLKRNENLDEELKNIIDATVESCFAAFVENVCEKSSRLS